MIDWSTKQIKITLMESYLKCQRSISPKLVTSHSVHCNNVVYVQEVPAEKFESDPIIFGDFMKVGAAKSDRIYEDITDMKKLHNVLSEVE